MKCLIRSLFVCQIGLLVLPVYSARHAMDLFQVVQSVELPSFLIQQQMFTDPNIAQGNWFGGGLAIGDYNRDSKPDIFISSFLADPDGIANAGAIYAFLGPDFTTTERLIAPEPEAGDNFGMQIEFEDMNADGIKDVVAGCLRTKFYKEDGSVLDQAGSIRVVWGPDYTTGIRFFDDFPQANATIGRGIEVADFNEDGVPDIAYGAINADGGLGKSSLRTVLILSNDKSSIPRNTVRSASAPIWLWETGIATGTSTLSPGATKPIVPAAFPKPVMSKCGLGRITQMVTC